MNTTENNTASGSIVSRNYTQEELDSPSTVHGWYKVVINPHARKCNRIKTLSDYLCSIEDNSFIPIPDNGEVHPKSGNRLVRIPFHWGDQAANHYAIISPKGEIVMEVRGCGGYAPYPLNPLETEDWEFSSHDTDSINAMHEYEEEFYAMEMSQFGANERADADKTGILRRLLRHYRSQQNPLRSLRREKGGTWTFHREVPDSSKLPEGTVIYHGDNWWVTWIK